MSLTDSMDPDALYRALCTRDARFDGRFFTGVLSTGIYCRPVCRVRAPQQRNCRFFDLAAQAETAGFRPCLRCRPELAPRARSWSAEDAADILIRQATIWLDSSQCREEPDSAVTILNRLAAHLGVTDRHVRRLFESRLGVSPVQYLLTQRLLAAKQLISDTRMSMADVAAASGFSSVRRFNSAFRERYGLNPTEMRRGTTGSDAGASGNIRLSWRPPYLAEAMLGFLSERALPGVELCDRTTLTFQRTLRLTARSKDCHGWIRIRLLPLDHGIELWASDGLVPALPELLTRTRSAFDLDAPMQSIDEALGEDFPGVEGLRVPGCFDGFELAVRAVLGQQITVRAARTLASRLVDRFGEPLNTGVDGLERLFPTPTALVHADPGELGALGITRQRQSALKALALAVLEGRLGLHESANVQEETRNLLDLPGIGPWTAQYIAMRALRWPDAWPPGDVAVHHSLGLDHLSTAAASKEAARRSTRWQPWRSYAVMRAWAMPTQSSESKTP